MKRRDNVVIHIRIRWLLTNPSCKLLNRPSVLTNMIASVIKIHVMYTIAVSSFVSLSTGTFNFLVKQANIRDTSKKIDKYIPPIKKAGKHSSRMQLIETGYCIIPSGYKETIDKRKKV